MHVVPFLFVVTNIQRKLAQYILQHNSQTKKRHCGLVTSNSSVLFMKYPISHATYVGITQSLPKSPKHASRTKRANAQSYSVNRKYVADM